MIQVFQYQNSPIQFEVIDGQVMANATNMADAFGKKMDGYLRLKSTKEYVSALESRNANLRIIKIQQGKGKVQGTWINEKLVIDFARWLSADFAVWCDEKIADLLRTGTATLSNPRVQQIAKHIERPAQIQNSKDVNAFHFENGGVDRIREYNQKNCYEHTGKFPNELVKIAKEQGIPAKHRTSGKEVVRYYKPEVAASMSMTDELCKRGTIGVTDAAKLCKPAIPLFEEMIKQGILEA